MKLYGSHNSPFVRHCRLAFTETGLDYSFVQSAPADMVGVSPTARIPYLQADGFHLSDSTSILKYIRDRADMPFLPKASDFDLYCLSNTIGDSSISVLMSFRLDGLTPENSKYLTRQAARIETGLAELESLELPEELPLNDAQLRLACILDWGLFRNMFHLEQRPRLAAFLELARTWKAFSDTSPRED